MAASTEFAELMTRATVADNTSTYNAAISACEKCDKWQLALTLLGLMTQAKVAAHTLTYNAAIRACKKGGL